MTTYRHRDSTLSNQTTKQRQIINHHANILFRFIRICSEMRIVIVYSVDFIHFFFFARSRASYAQNTQFFGNETH